MLTAEQKFALEMARLYRSQWGWNPIPSKCEFAPDEPRRKKPLYSFASEYGWDTMFPDEWFTEAAWEKTPTTNLQLMCGSHWNLFIIDLDGPQAIEIWDWWLRKERCPKTWESHRVGGHSRHVWFRPPDGWEGPIRKRFLWRGEPGTHSGIELLGDRSLITVPPSRHIETGEPYEFRHGHAPHKGGGAQPAKAPWWLINAPSCDPEKKAEDYVTPVARPKPIRLDGERLDRNDIIDRIHDKPAMAKRWGLRLVGSRPGPNGWWPCHAVDREDRVPSAAIHVASGVYVDKGSDARFAFDNLMVAMGQAHDRQDALQRLSRQI